MSGLGAIGAGVLIAFLAFLGVALLAYAINWAVKLVKSIWREL